MAACVYIKHKDQCKVLIAKTKLPSLKGNHTIPKLELNALTLAARLTLSSYKELREVTTSRQVQQQQHHGTLRIHSAPTSNPSDCASRGLTAKELQSHIWWEGPDFLKENPEKWPPETRIFEFPQENQHPTHSSRSIKHISVG
ncbi:hypothetical protein OSTOST_15922 [Ostertagia ostertagi]